MTAYTLHTKDLHRILVNANLATSRDAFLVVVTCVHLELGPTTVRASATDRYRVHRDTATPHKDTPADTPEVSVLIEHTHVASLTSFLKGDTGLVVVTVDDALHSVTAQLYDRRALQVPTTEGEFPKLDAVMPEHTDDPATVEPVAFDPKLLAGFAKVLMANGRVAGGSRGYPIRLQVTGSRKPARVEIGPSFVGAIMPVAMSKDTPTTQPVKD